MPTSMEGGRCKTRWMPSHILKSSDRSNLETDMIDSPLSVQLKQAYNLSEKDLMKIIPLFETIRVKKNEHLYRSGEIVRQVYYVEQGCLRQYYINNNGEERTIYFKTEDEWCSELVSFLDNKPTELCVQALENSTLQAINQKNWVYAISEFKSFTLGFIRAQQDTNYMLKKGLLKQPSKRLKKNTCGL